MQRQNKEGATPAKYPEIKPGRYYVVDISYCSTNPVHRVILVTDLSLRDIAERGWVFTHEDRILIEFEKIYYLKVVCEIEEMRNKSPIFFG